MDFDFVFFLNGFTPEIKIQSETKNKRVLEELIHKW